MDGALASKMVLVTLVGSRSDSRRAARHEGSTVPAGDAKSCPVLAREDLSSVVLTTVLQTATGSSLGTKLGSSRGGPRGGERISFL